MPRTRIRMRKRMHPPRNVPSWLLHVCSMLMSMAEAVEVINCECKESPKWTIKTAPSR